MKRLIQTIILSMLMSLMAASVIAFAGTVSTVEAGNSGLTSVKVNGTAESGVVAVTIQIRDMSDNVLAMETTGVDGEHNFERTLTGLSLTAGTEYKACVADFGGGSWKTVTFTVTQQTRRSSSRSKTTSNYTSTFSKHWYEKDGKWMIAGSNKINIKNAWLCDDEIAANGNNVWYLIGADGVMLTYNLVQDATGNYYSLESSHNGYYGMLRYRNGYYNCNGTMVYLEFEQSHNGSYGAIKNKDGIEKLKEIYGVNQINIDNNNIVHTKDL